MQNVQVAHAEYLNPSLGWFSMQNSPRSQTSPNPQTKLSKPILSFLRLPPGPRPRLWDDNFPVGREPVVIVVHHPGRRRRHRGPHRWSGPRVMVVVMEVRIEAPPEVMATTPATPAPASAASEDRWWWRRRRRWRRLDHRPHVHPH
jgi:hypothetical protein